VVWTFKVSQCNIPKPNVLKNPILPINPTWVVLQSELADQNSNPPPSTFSIGLGLQEQPLVRRHWGIIVFPDTPSSKLLESR
jgi:hypothetical protein